MCRIWRSGQVVLLMLVLFEQSMLSWSRSFGDGVKEGEVDVALELKRDTFNSSLWAAPTDWALVEFYNRWCPACQKFKPHYEKVAKLFNGPDALYPGVVLLSKVDCADAVDQILCRRFSIQRWPTLLWGKPTVLAWGSRTSDQDTSFEQIPVKTAYNANGLLEWINTRLERSFTFEPTMEQRQSLQTNGVGAKQMVATLHDIEESTAQAYHIITTQKLLMAKHRAPFSRFLELLVVHHPSKRCRAGSAEILQSMKEIWPAEHTLEVDGYTQGAAQSDRVVADVGAMKRFRICGEKFPSERWITCKSETGGYSCGLWYLFHALSIRVDDAESNNAMKAIRGFVENFFVCEECRHHFLKLSASAVDTVNTRRSLALWMWRAHNEVNKRLADEDRVNNVKSSRPKVQWPPQKMCIYCRKQADLEGDIEWDENNVYLFLRKIYGNPLDAVPVDVGKSLSAKVKQVDNVRAEEAETNNSAAVPVGAAAAIAMASCGFGVAACCWRLQQKKRK